MPAVVLCLRERTRGRTNVRVMAVAGFKELDFDSFHEGELAAKIAAGRGEVTGRIERRAIAIEQRLAWVVDRPALVHGAKRRLPQHELKRIATQTPHTGAIEKAGR